MPGTAPPKPATKVGVPPHAAAHDASTAPLPLAPSQRDGLLTVLNRNEFYRDSYRYLVIIALGEAVAVILLIFAILTISGTYQPKDRYFATTAEGRLIPMVPLDEPYVDKAKVVAWANTAATEIMTFGFHDYRQRLSYVGAKYFTEDGWASFTKALEKSRIIEAIEGSQQVVTAAPAAAGVVIKEGLENNVYTWVLQLPMIITYTAGTKTQSTRTVLTLRIVRVPTLKNPEGIGIQQWIAEQG